MRLGILFHRWPATTRSGPLPSEGDGPLTLAGPDPTLVVVHPVCDGYAVTFDAASGLLRPLDVHPHGERPGQRPLPSMAGPLSNTDRGPR